MNNLSIIILAAGQGTRMKSKTPKVLHTISGKPMLYYSIREAKKLSSDIHVVLYHKASLVQDSMNKYFENINYHMQDYENFPGTGGAIMNVTPKNKKVLLLNADMPLIEADELIKLCQNEELLTMSVLELKDADGYGRVVVEDGKVLKIVEQKDCTNNELVINTANAGVYCFDKDFLLKHLPKLSNDNNQKEYYITDLIEMAVNKNINTKPVIVEEENFKGVNSKLDLTNAQTIHQNRIKKKHLENGVIMRLDQTIYIEDSVRIEGECIIENGVTLLGETIIRNSHIKTNSIVEDSFLEDSIIGPMARIRPKSNLKDTQIGNFVEIKKSNLTGVKAGHLSYLGDSEIKQGTNIGAGTITCNYDGKNKYKTIIGENVFIGSNTELVAPLTIEDDCMIGAGSTITKDIKSGHLVVTRSKIVSVKDYFYKFFRK